MRKNLKRISALILVLAVILSATLVAPLTAEAVNTPLELESTAVSFWADPENRITQDDLTAFSGGDKTSMVGAVGVYARSTSSDKYYLFLPSNADCNALKVWFNANSCTVNGNALESGQKTDVFDDCDEGGVMHTYTLVLGNTTYTLNVMKSGDVGTVYIDTDSGSISKITRSSDHSTYEGGTIMVVNADGTIEYDGAMTKMSGRGNGTWGTGSVKNPYNVKLAASTKLLGMPKARKWCLLANSGDGTFVKNQLTYDFADYIGIKYQTHMKPVDLYVNQQYYGSYQLAEKVEIKSNRVNITDNYTNLEIANGTVDSNGVVTPADMDSLGLSTRTIDANNSTVSIQTEFTSTYFGHAVGSRRYSAYASTSTQGTSYTNINDPDDLTGGYIFELEISQRWAKENAGFCAYNRQGWTVKSNDYISRHQVDYCYNLLYALGGAIYNGGTVPSTSVTTTCNSLGNTSGLNNYGSKSVTNPAPAEQYRGKKWSDLLDSSSAVKYYWTQEFFKNMDSSTSSTYFYKDVDEKDSKLYAGPMWDMDNSIGYTSNGSRWGYSWTSTDGWYTKNTRIYRWRTRDSTTSYSSDDYAPLSFYGALATNCSDFWQSAQSEWYRKVSPAVEILISDTDDSGSVLHNIDYYVDTVSKSALMNNHKVRDTDSFDAQSVKSGLKAWMSNRKTWIDGQFSRVNITDCSIDAIDAQTYNGTPAKPKVTVTYNGANLIEGEDYTVEYTSNDKVGNAFAVVTGKGFYTGSMSTSFRIVKGTLRGSVIIPQAAYSGDVISADVVNSDGDEITGNITYQWYADGTAISGATSREYTVTDGDRNKALTVVVSGDGVNLDGSLTSGECEVKSGTKPENYTESIAEWNYDYTANPDALVNVDENGGYAYSATDGQLGSFATLSGSVTATTKAKIKWSDDYFANDSVVLSPDCSPIIGTSKTDGIAWGEYPYFETAVKTKGYENITFTAKLGGTNRAPSTYKLQYSLDGTSYTDISGATYVITNNKTMETAFSDVELPAECADQNLVYIRAVAYDDVAINSKYRIVGITSGDASINNVSVKGTRIAVITELEAPTIINSSQNGDGTALYDTDMISLRDNNGGADVFYTLNNGTETQYTDAFNPFDENAVIGDTVTLTAYSKFGDIVSDVTTQTFTFAGKDINHFIYGTYTENVSGGALYSNGGAYDGSAKMTAYTDGASQYVPLWNEKNGAFSIAPDDGAVWTDKSGYTFELSTAGYTDLTLTAKAYTTGKGPKSLSVQYSLDGITWNSFGSTINLPANGALEQVFLNYSLPAACYNKKKVLVRLVTAENATHGDSTEASTTLHNNMSKGNLYINNIIFAGNDYGEAKMPYTNKTSDWFGSTGSIKYYSADGRAMYYSVVNGAGEMIASGNYNDAAGIEIQNVPAFNPYDNQGYTVSVWTGSGDDRSEVNTRKYYYKGDTVCEFNYNSSTRALENYLDSTNTIADNTSGANAGTLSMLPNGVTRATLASDDTYGVKVAWASDNVFTYDGSTPLDTPNGGYWLITTSTLGYSSLSLNLEQLSSNKGPRDWGLAYSTDGTNYTYIANSNVRAISNDASSSTVETYNNFALPTACDNQQTLYLKLFINGGESIDGNELRDMLKGNTGIENITISGIGEAPDVDFTVNTVSYDGLGGAGYPVDAVITVDGNDYDTDNGSATLQLKTGNTYSASVSVNGTFANSFSFTVSENGSVTVPVVAVDMNGDGYINGKDLAYIKKLTNSDKRSAYKNAFSHLVGAEASSFTYDN
ncbi:MAG: CotH kinase family protein [Eubacterium sp.]|nr:CotH kinase family protein [Eubacterium sp.]